MIRSALHLRPVATVLLAAVTLTSCIAADDVAESPTADVTQEASATPTATPAPLVGLAALSTDPGAVAIATLRSRYEQHELLIISGVPSPEDRTRFRALDQVEVLATTSSAGARVARSISATVPATSTVIGSVEQALADLATAVMRTDAAGSTRVVHVLGSIDPSVINGLLDQGGTDDLWLAFDGDVRAGGPAADALQAAIEGGYEVVAGAEVEQWQIAVATAGLTVPGGGQLLTGKRYIAAYGTPGTPSLGVLGEQGVEAAHERILRIAEPYDDGVLPIVPTFEIIAAVASASATADGDYSYGISFDFIREWVDYAAANDILVILDIQPGRTDFLTHAKQYEEFLVQPHVGLGLDPEWRLKSNQVHLRQIGTVDGAEINTVVEYLAGLVRQHDLPQKMLVMHQFKLSMITNRDLVTAPDELLVVLHMDGQGGQPAKDSTYQTLISADQPWAPGWKNFYDEDIPMAGAARVLAVQPQPIFISFQ